MHFTVAQADGHDEGDHQGIGPSSFVFHSAGAPQQLPTDPGQPVMIAGRPYLVGGPAELEARAYLPSVSNA